MCVYMRVHACAHVHVCVHVRAHVCACMCARACVYKTKIMRVKQMGFFYQWNRENEKIRLTLIKIDSNNRLDDNCFSSQP